MFVDVGAFFTGSVYRPDRSFLLAVLAVARKHGYSRFVEPCAGQLALSCLARQAGFDEKEASDVTLFSGIVGRYAEGRGIEDLEITLGSRKLVDPVEALYELKRAQIASGGGVEYTNAMLRDYDRRREEITETLGLGLRELKAAVGSVRYRDMDMFEHLGAVLGDEKAVVCLCAPTWTRGYEHLFDAVSEAMDWNEPAYTVVDASSVHGQLLDVMKDARCLVLSYQEAEAGACVGEPVYARKSGRSGMYSYIVSNRPEEVEGLVGRTCSVKPSAKLSPARHAVLPFDYEITEKSRLSVIRASPENVRYYRRLFTRNFVPSDLSSGYLMLVDGYVAGVFGYITMANTLSGVGCDSVFIGYAVATASRHRVSKLLHVVACQRSSVQMELDDVRMQSVENVRTAVISKHRQSNEMRGVMKLVSRKERDGGYILTYESPIKDQTSKAVISEFASKERAWMHKKG